MRTRATRTAQRAPSPTVSRRQALARAALSGAPLTPRVRGPLAIERGGRAISREEHETFVAKLGYERAHPAREWLRNARWERAWRRNALSAALGLPKGALSQLERNPDYVVHPEYAARLRDALGLSEADTLAISADAQQPLRPTKLPAPKPTTTANSAGSCGRRAKAA